MEELINLITQNGIGVICVAFLIYFINTTMKDNNKILDDIQKTLVAINTNLTTLSARVDKLEDKISKKKTKKEESE
jgi:cell division protein FtsB